MFRTILLFITIMFIQAIVLLAQKPTGTILGTVIDGSTRQPLLGANVWIPELERGDASDSKGIFRIEDVPVGVYSIRVSYIGFQSQILTDIVVRSNRTQTVTVKLPKTTVKGTALIVTTGYFQESEIQHVSRSTLKHEEIRRFPGAAQELNRVIKTLPGVVSTENTQDLMVRGGSAQENATYINNIFVPVVSHFEGQDARAYGPVGLINTDLVENMEFYAGGYSASYGNRMSSVTVVDYSRGSRTWQGQLNLNMSGFGGVVEGPVGSDGSFWISANRSYLDLISGAVGAIGSPRFADIQGKADFDLNADNHIAILHIFGDSGTEWDREEARDEGRISYLDLHNQVNTSGVNWRRIWNDKVYSNTSISYSFLQQDITTRYTKSNNNEIIYNNRHDYVYFRNVNYWRATDMHRFEFGSDIIYTHGDFEYYFSSFVNEANIERPPVSRNLQIGSWNVELFGSYIFKPASRLTVTLGSRLGYNTINEDWTLSPRFGTSIKITRQLTLKAAGGIFRQALPPVIRSQQETFRDLRDPHVRHLILGFDYLLDESTKLTAEVYDKQYRQMPVQPAGYNGLPTFVFDDLGTFFDDLDDDGEAWARGIDVMIQRKMADGFYGIISGSYFRTRYKDYKGDWQNREFDVNFLFNFIAGYRPNDKWEVSVRWTYIGSRPRTPVDLEASALKDRIIYDLSRYNQAEMPAFHSLYLRGDRRFFFNNFTLTTFVEIWNVYNRSNIESYYWNQNNQKLATHEPFSFLPVGGIVIAF